MKRIWNCGFILFTALVLFLSGCGKKAETAKAPETTAPSAAETVPHAVVETVTTDTFEMDYCRFGTGEKTLVVLPGLSVQSVMGSADAIAGRYQMFADDYTVYVFDRRKEVPASYSNYDMADDTAAALEQLGLDHASLFGASQGGMIAMVIVAEHPELADALILASTSARVSEEQFQTIAKWINYAENNDAEGLYLSFGEEIYPKAVFEQYREALMDAAKTVTEAELKKFVILAEGIKGFDITEKLSGIRCPVYAAGDRQDRVLGGDAVKAITEQLSQAAAVEYHETDGYGHALYDADPDFVKNMLEFLRKETNGKE